MKVICMTDIEAIILITFQYIDVKYLIHRIGRK